ncbi:RAMP superfamily CRISPR-associated protein [uncultured Azohydromonas sp.]|jgi:hypothetical protein|uniref:RAMP superfamily CRISPR-associated protein n=1 Tax=uncultured Azohydromonas sp. TaxID=487342 RepID=UPI002610A643|nr:RAMP superfamily CRISPR-associated protein [uncultured Azohydromonas sp.]
MDSRVITLRYKLRFLTPAFLGNALQSAQWRTPPFKALLRQWWRVAYAADQAQHLNLAAMRQAEGQLFGVAADRESDSRRSQLRLRLSQWTIGKQRDWTGLDAQRVTHPEVKNREGKPAPVGAHLYLGYGPLEFRDRQTALKRSAAIQSGEEAVWSLAFPANGDARRLHRALWLLQHYGTVGGRSRNGWGSFSLTPADANTPALDGPLDRALTLPWRDALQQDWPQAIGTDADAALIWQTEALPNWQLVMRRLAEIKIGLRTQFRFPAARADGQIHDRHWLSYPVTNHAVKDWGNNARLPNSLRFKVRADTDGKLRGVVFHVPCLPPPAFRPDRAAIVAVWQQVHHHLDAEARLQRIPA